MAPGRGGVCGAGASWRKLVLLALLGSTATMAFVGPTHARTSPSLQQPHRSSSDSTKNNRLSGAGGLGPKKHLFSMSAAADSTSKRGVVRLPRLVPLSKRLGFLKRRGSKEHAPLKVALLVEPTPFTHVCGYANRFKEMLRYLKEGGETAVVVATPDDKAEAPTEYCGFPVSTVTGYRLPMYPEVCLTGDLKGEAKKVMDDFRPDLIHVSSPGFLVMAAVVYAKARGIPLVMSYHTHLPVYAEKYTGWIPYSRQSAWKYIKLLHSFADLTLVTSPQILSEFKEQGIRRVAVWRKGVDVEVFHPKHRSDEARRALTATPDKPVLLYVGRLSVEKRLEDCAAALDACPDASLALVGGGPHRDALEQYFARFGDRVRFLGVKRGAELSSLYASADVFCMPSDSETLGFVVIEAMASGLAVVAARAGGIPSIVDHDSNGILVEPRDPELFADSVRQVLANPARRAELSERARSDAEGWGWEAATKHLRHVQYPAAVRRHAAIARLRATETKFRIFPPTVRRVLRRRVSGALAYFSSRVKGLVSSFSPFKFIALFTNKFKLVTAY